MTPLADCADLWTAIFGPQTGYLGLFSALRPSPDAKTLADGRQAFFPYPDRASEASSWLHRSSEEGREAFYCAHLLRARRRTKEHAAPVRALWAEADGEPGEDLSAAPEPTAIVESSPGRRHLFWRLMRPLVGAEAEALNRRLSGAINADPSGWDLSQMTRPPGTRNRKYEHAPLVRLVFLDAGVLYHPRELDLALPPDPRPKLFEGATLAPRTLSRSPGHKATSSRDDLSRLSRRMRRLAEAGNAGAGHPYRSRSEADFAVAVAMIGAGYAPEEAASVLLDPSLGISEKALDQGRHAWGYVWRTVGEAARRASPADSTLGCRRGPRRETRPPSRAAERDGR